MLFKRTLLLLALPGIIFSADAMKRPADGAPEGEPAAKQRCVDVTSWEKYKALSLMGDDFFIPKELIFIIASWMELLQVMESDFNENIRGPQTLCDSLKKWSSRDCGPHLLARFLKQSLNKNYLKLPEIVSPAGQTALIVACRTGDLCSTKVLLLASENQRNQTLECLKNSDIEGTTLLHWAAYRGDHNIAQLLFEYAGDQSASLILTLNSRKQSALHTAVSWNKKEFVEVIIHAAGSEAIKLILLRDSYGETALKIAQDEGYTDIVELLEETLRASSSGNS